MATISRVCRKCGQDTPFDQLQKNKNCRDGVDALCKQCGKRLAIEWGKKNPEKARRNKNNYKKRDPERTKRKSKEDYEKHKEAKNEWRRNHYAENPEPELKAAKEYRQSPKGKEVQRTAQHKRRARKFNAPGEFTSEDVTKQRQCQKNKCYWCGKKLGKVFHPDHVIPLSRGGDNWPSNIVVACPRCNQSKNDKLPHEWHGNGGKLL